MAPFNICQAPALVVPEYYQCWREWPVPCDEWFDWCDEWFDPHDGEHLKCYTGYGLPSLRVLYRACPLEKRAIVSTEDIDFIPILFIFDTCCSIPMNTSTISTLPCSSILLEPDVPMKLHAGETFAAAKTSASTPSLSIRRGVACRQKHFDLLCKTHSPKVNMSTRTLVDPTMTPELKRQS